MEYRARKLVESLARPGVANPVVLEGLYRYALAAYPNLAVRIVSADTAPPAVLADAAASPNPRLRAAWLSKPDRTVSELLEAARTERNSEVLAAVASSELVSGEVLDSLAARRTQKIAWALCGREDLSEKAATHILVTLDRCTDRASGQYVDRVVSLARRHPRALSGIADTLTSPDLIRVAVAGELTEGAQRHLIDVRLRYALRCLVGAPRRGQDRLVCRDMLADFFANPSVRSREAAEFAEEVIAAVEDSSIVTARDLAKVVRDSLAEKCRPQQMQLPAADTASLLRMWEEADSHRRRELALDVVAHGCCDSALASRVLTEIGGPVVSAAVSERFAGEDDALAEIADSCPEMVHRALFDRAADPEKAVRRFLKKAVGRLFTSNLSSLSFEQGECNGFGCGEILAAVPWRAVNRFDPFLAAASAQLADCLGTDTGRWELWLKLCGQRGPESLPELLATVEGACSDRPAEPGP